MMRQSIPNFWKNARRWSSPIRQQLYCPDGFRQAHPLGQAGGDGARLRSNVSIYLLRSGIINLLPRSYAVNDTGRIIMGFLLFDLFLLVVAVWSIFSGINKIRRPVQLLKRKGQKKKKTNSPEAFTEPSRRRILFTRIRGAARFARGGLDPRLSPLQYRLAGKAGSNLVTRSGDRPFAVRTDH